MRSGMVDSTAIRARYEALSPHLDERGRRVFAASEARGSEIWWDRVRVARERHRGQHDRAGLDACRVRRPSGGRKPLVLTDASLLDDLVSLVSPGERGERSGQRACRGFVARRGGHQSRVGVHVDAITLAALTVAVAAQRDNCDRWRYRRDAGRHEASTAPANDCDQHRRNRSLASPARLVG